MATITSPETRVLDETDKQIEPPYHLILLDDDAHSYAYVIGMMAGIFGYSRDKGFAIACIVDKDGQAIVMTGSKATMELKQEAIHAYGADPLMETSAGSMSAIIEPAPC